MTAAINSARTSAALAWTAPSDAGTASITGYKIEFKNGNNAWATLTATTGSTTTSYTHTATFTSGTTYKYRVSAVSSAGTGDFVEATATESSVPGAPTNLRAVINTAKTSAKIIWTAPTDTGTSAITGYKIEIRVGSGVWTTVTANTASTTTSFTDTRTFTWTYHYRISAINSAGTGESATVTAVQEERPGAPTNLTITLNARLNGATLSWTAPSDSGSSPIVGYKIQFQYASGHATSPWRTVSSKHSSTTYAHTTDIGLDTTYTYRVSAINSEGTGSHVEASVLPAVPGAVTNLTAVIAPNGNSATLNLDGTQ